jgi:hypothetical protein
MSNLGMKRYSNQPLPGVGRFDQEAREHVTPHEGGSIVHYDRIAKANIDAMADDVARGYTAKYLKQLLGPGIDTPMGSGFRMLLGMAGPVAVPVALAVDLGSLAKDGADAALAGVKGVCFALMNRYRAR